MVLVPFGGYFLTNLLGPVVALRYHYPFIACAPLLVYLLWTVWEEARREEPVQRQEKKKVFRGKQ